MKAWRWAEDSAMVACSQDDGACRLGKEEKLRGQPRVLRGMAAREGDLGTGWVVRAGGGTGCAKRTSDAWKKGVQTGWPEEEKAVVGCAVEEERKALEDLGGEGGGARGG